jgi:hypothetical protein
MYGFVPACGTLPQPPCTWPLQVRPFSTVDGVRAGSTSTVLVSLVDEHAAARARADGAAVVFRLQPLCTVPLQVAPSITLTVFAAVFAT